MTYENRHFQNIRLAEKTFTDLVFTDCTFSCCTLDTCALVRCAFSGCTFTDCTVISLRSRDSWLKFAEFERCSLIGIHWSSLVPPGRIAESLRALSGCLLKYNSFSGMKLPRFSFSGSELLESAFEDCALTESSFTGCRLDKTQFTNCDLRKADFRDASGYQIAIDSCRLRGARFSFPEAVRLLDTLGIRID